MAKLNDESHNLKTENVQLLEQIKIAKQHIEELDDVSQKIDEEIPSANPKFALKDNFEHKLENLKN